jgi:hypothetical protein
MVRTKCHTAQSLKSRPPKVNSAGSTVGLVFESPLGARNVDNVVLDSEVWQFSKGEGGTHLWTTMSWTTPRVHLVCCYGMRETPFPMMRMLMDEQRKVMT